MRILYYNWVDYLDDERRGGGVAVYQRNVMRDWAESDVVDASFLCSGLGFDITGQPPRWEQIRHGPAQDRERRFEIVNSGVQGPGHHSYGDPAQVDHAETLAVFADFLERTGPYDVVHFNNLEGLPARALEVAAASGARIVLSLHNYYPFCSQVNFWQDEARNCTGYDNGRNCVGCVPHLPSPKLVRHANALAYRLKCAGIRPGTRSFDILFGQSMRIGRRVLNLRRRRKGAERAAEAATAVPERAARTEARASTAQGAHYVTRRAEMVRLINSHCHKVLCVSDAVRRIAGDHGITPELLETCRIGSVEAGKFALTSPRDSFLASDGTLHMAYLGYMRRDKGIFFLLDALEALPDAMAARLRLTVAARRGDAETMARLDRLGTRLAALNWHDGYGHDDLDDILGDVALGLIPVQWEDNLPQVAIEMHARHIPLLCSDLGGAHELGNCPELTFPATGIADFRDRIEALLAARILPGDYWATAQAPVTMQAHQKALGRAYGLPD